MDNYLIQKKKNNNNNNIIIIILILHQFCYIVFVIYIVYITNDIKNKLDNEIYYINIVKKNSFLENKTQTDDFINKTKSIVDYLCKLINCDIQYL